MILTLPSQSRTIDRLANIDMPTKFLRIGGVEIDEPLSRSSPMISNGGGK